MEKYLLELILKGLWGVLTTEVFVIFAIVLPCIILFYMVFGLLEDYGYIPRIAVILDRILHRVGLHGYSVIPMLLACGCNVPGILAVRNLEVIPYVLGGILFINILHATGIIKLVGKLLHP
ncbi:nucleoside recognition domain-containing protein [Acetivibrio cellulolyticus]